MQITQLLSDSALGLIGGYVGTKVMEPVSMKLYELEPEADRQQEDRVRPGPPYEIAARKTSAPVSVGTGSVVDRVSVAKLGSRNLPVMVRAR